MIGPLTIGFRLEAENDDDFAPAGATVQPGEFVNRSKTRRSDAVPHVRAITPHERRGAIWTLAPVAGAGRKGVEWSLLGTVMEQFAAWPVRRDWTR